MEYKNETQSPFMSAFAFSMIVYTIVSEIWLETTGIMVVQLPVMIN